MKTSISKHINKKQNPTKFFICNSCHLYFIIEWFSNNIKQLSFITSNFYYLKY